MTHAKEHVGAAEHRAAFKRNLVAAEKLRTPPSLDSDIPFGLIPCDHMVVCDFLPQSGGWQTPEIVPFTPFSLSPTCLVFHYGQEVFEGLKAYLSAENQSILLFRPEANAQRMWRSARRLGMEPVPEGLFLDCVEELVRTERRWLLPYPGSLYIRPALIALDSGVSYRASSAYRFFVCVCPVKSYYSREAGVSVYIERELVRAVPGGVGEAKCGGNYAGALPALLKAKELGAEQVVWLDAFQHKFVEEVGAMNIMFVYGSKIITPPLTGSILPGVTRMSLIELAWSLGYEVEETKIAIDDVLADAETGKLTEAFGCGTAAVISPIDAFLDGTRRVLVNSGKVGDVSRSLRTALTDIQFGRAPDRFGWCTTVVPG